MTGVHREEVGEGHSTAWNCLLERYKLNLTFFRFISLYSRYAGYRRESSNTESG